MRTIAKNWGVRNIGSMQGKTAVVTGANSGIGFHTALELGRAGAQVVVACRDPQRGAEALARLQEGAPGPADRFQLEALDLAELASVRAFAARFLARDRPLDLLINNAGVMAIPTRELTADGFERQFGTNHLGHFALTGLLLPALRRASGDVPRVVTLSSGLAAMGKIDLANLQSERSYSPTGAYSASKLANLLFTNELGRRAASSGWALLSVAAHPGATYSNLQKHTNFANMMVMKLIAQQADAGALPSLYAATGEVATGEYFGPEKMFHMNGAPVEVRQPKRAYDAAVAGKLWTSSEKLTGVSYDFGQALRKSA